jgi:xylan 1,4-beta-xylosidase
MGEPLDPTPAQVKRMNRATALPTPEQTHLTGGKLKLTLTPNALVLVKVEH